MDLKEANDLVYKFTQKIINESKDQYNGFAKALGSMEGLMALAFTNGTESVIKRMKEVTNDFQT